MPTTVIAAKTVIAAGVVALAATGTAVAFAAPTSRPDQVTAHVTAAAAHRGQHAGEGATGSPTSPTASASAPGTGEHGDGGSSGPNASATHGKSGSATSSGAGAHTVGAQAFGLCTAFAHGGLGTRSTAYASLAKAAGGAGNIHTYCATVAHPGNPGGSSTSHPAASHPTPKPTDPFSPRPTVKPTDPRHQARQATH